MSIPNVSKAPKNYAVLPFYATAALFFILLTVLMFVSVNFYESKNIFNLHYFNDHLLSIVHIAAIGWGTMIIFGAAYQLIPVISENDLYSSPLALASYCFLLPGVLLLAYSFWFFIIGWPMIIGGAMIVVAAIFYAYNVLKTIQLTKKFTWEKMFLFSSSLWLVITVIIGLLLAINLRYPFFEKNHLEILKLHAHAGLAGWFLQLITGVSVKLVPMFLFGKSDKIVHLKMAFIFHNLGLLLFLIDGYFNGVTSRSLLYGLLIITGIVFWLLHIRDVYKSRMKKVVDDPMKQSLWAFAFLVIALVFIPFIHYGVNMKWTFLYGVFLFLGWITSLIIGMTFKTLPFIVWNNHYKKLHGLGKLPMPKDLYNDKLLKYQFWLFMSAIYIMALSLLFEQPIGLKIALGIWVLVALVYAINVGIVLTHKTKQLEDGNINR